MNSVNMSLVFATRVDMRAVRHIKHALCEGKTSINRACLIRTAGVNEFKSYHVNGTVMGQVLSKTTKHIIRWLTDKPDIKVHDHPANRGRRDV